MAGGIATKSCNTSFDEDGLLKSDIIQTSIEKVINLIRLAEPVKLKYKVIERKVTRFSENAADRPRIVVNRSESDTVSLLSLSSSPSRPVTD